MNQSYETTTLFFIRVELFQFFTAHSLTEQLLTIGDDRCSNIRGEIDFFVADYSD